MISYFKKNERILKDAQSEKVVRYSRAIHVIFIWFIDTSSSSWASRASSDSAGGTWGPLLRLEVLEISGDFFHSFPQFPHVLTTKLLERLDMHSTGENDAA